MASIDGQTRKYDSDDYDIGRKDSDGFMEGRQDEFGTDKENDTVNNQESSYQYESWSESAYDWWMRSGSLQSDKFTTRIYKEESTATIGNSDEDVVATRGKKAKITTEEVNATFVSSIRLPQSAPAADAYSAAWAFVRPSHKFSPELTGGTGIAFIDKVLRQHYTSSPAATARLPAIEIRGGRGVGKTWTLISLAARFVVETCSSHFLSNQGTSNCCEAPHVIVLDSGMDVTLRKLARVVQAVLQLKHRSAPDDQMPRIGAKADSERTFLDPMPERIFSEMPPLLERDMRECLARIHIASAPSCDAPCARTWWISVLEAIRCHQVSLPLLAPPMLLLWDGFLAEPYSSVHHQPHGGSNDINHDSDCSYSSYGDSVKMEIVRLLERLLSDCSVLLVLTTTATTAMNTSTAVASAIATPPAGEYKQDINPPQTPVPTLSMSSTSSTSKTPYYWKKEYERFITHRIRLDRKWIRSTNHEKPTHLHENDYHSLVVHPAEYVATVHRNAGFNRLTATPVTVATLDEIPFTITSAGIIS